MVPGVAGLGASKLQGLERFPGGSTPPGLQRDTYGEGGVALGSSFQLLARRLAGRDQSYAFQGSVGKVNLKTPLHSPCTHAHPEPLLAMLGWSHWRLALRELLTLRVLPAKECCQPVWKCQAGGWQALPSTPLPPMMLDTGCSPSDGIRLGARPLSRAERHC
jgi:hypothetical protein